MGTISKLVPRSKLGANYVVTTIVTYIQLYIYLLKTETRDPRGGGCCCSQDVTETIASGRGMYS